MSKTSKTAVKKDNDRFAAVNIIVAGAAGRMGRIILGLARHDAWIRIAGAFERPDHPAVGHDVGTLIGTDAVQVPVHPDIRECIDRGHVVIDFTHADATAQNLAAALKAKRAMVIGTTGLAPAFMEKLRQAAKTIPIVQAPNMSIGVNLLFQLALVAGQKLDDHYDVEIVEEHHRHKKDAPSGTALELARQIARARKIELDTHAVYGRKGMTGERKRGTIGIHAVRGGDTVGDHRVSFIADGERIELVHRASSRESFAHGALLAAKFVANQKPGLYNMQQVLGL